MLENTSLTKKAKVCAVGILAGLMVACGGGASDGCLTLNPARNPNLPSCTSSTSSTPSATSSTSTAAIAIAPLTLSLIEASGATMTSVSPDRTGTLKAVVKDSKGNAAPNIAVTFTTT